MSVGFILVSPYWQYVTVYRGNPSMKLILRSAPLGFSINQYFGVSASIRQIVCWFTRSHCLAYSEIGARLPSLSLSL